MADSTDPVTANEELARRLFEAWRPSGGKFWTELGSVEQGDWKKLARWVESELLA